jgi:hypothetical protein
MFKLTFILFPPHPPDVVYSPHVRLEGNYDIFLLFTFNCLAMLTVYLIRAIMRIQGRDVRYHMVRYIYDQQITRGIILDHLLGIRFLH